MDKKTWDSLERVVQDQLASKHGITRSGEDNQIVLNEELAKIPDTKEVTPKEDEPKKKTRKIFAKKAPKSSRRRKSTK